MDLNMMSQKCSIRFRLSECGGQSMIAFPSSSCHMRPGIIMYQEEPRTYWTIKGSNNGSINFIQIPNNPTHTPRQTLIHHQIDHAEQCYRQHNIHSGFSRPFLCHMSSEWICSHLWKEQGASAGPANSVVLWQMAVELHGAGRWAQDPLEDARPSGHTREVCF